MQRQSKKQAARERELSKQKKLHIERQLKENDRIFCDGGCGRFFTDLESALAALQGHHHAHRGMGASFNRPGIDAPQNLRYLCWLCHRRAHNERVV